MIEENKKSIRKTWKLCIVVLYIIEVFICLYFKLDRNSVKAVTTITLGLVVLSYFIINTMWYKEFSKKLEELDSNLHKDKNYNKYIEENKKLLIGKKSMVNIARLNINIAVAYCYMKEFSKAKEHLLVINENKIHGLLKIVYKVDLIYILFFLKEKEKAIDILEKNRKQIMKFKDVNSFKNIISAILVFELYSNNKKEEAISILDNDIIKNKGNNQEKELLYLKNFLLEEY